MILGVTGTLAAGKDTVAEYLVKRGFVYASLSDAVRDECDVRGLPKDRDTLRQLANDLRREQGNAVLAERALAKLKEGQAHNAVVVSIRNPAEVERLRQEPGFHLVSVDASIELRHARVRERNSERDQVDLDTFKRQEAAEMSHADPANQQLQQVIASADVQLMNTGTFDELYQQVDALLKRFQPADKK